jgi:hypothetical protein
LFDTINKEKSPFAKDINKNLQDILKIFNRYLKCNEKCNNAKIQYKQEIMPSCSHFQEKHRTDLPVTTDERKIHHFLFFALKKKMGEFRDKLDKFGQNC